MGRLTDPRPAALLAAVVLCATALAPATASAGIGTEPIISFVVSPASPDGANGWYVSDAVVTFTVDLQGFAEQTRSAPCDNPLSNTIDADTTGTDVTCEVTSDGGTSLQTVTIKRDATDPTLDPEISPSTTLVRNQSASATPGANDATSGVDTKGCDPVDTRTVGSHTVECHATDFAGNTATESEPYTVIPYGPADDVKATAGDHQVAYQFAQFASDLVVTVRDAHGNPVPGVKVAFKAPLTGPSADLSLPSELTNSSGVASVLAYANSRVGSYTVKGKVANVGTAEFHLTNARAPYFTDGFSNGLARWTRTGHVSIATNAGHPAPGALLRADHEKTFATHRLPDTYATACASAWVRLNSIGNEAVAILRFRAPGDSGISRVSVGADHELFVRNDRRGGIKLSGRRLRFGEWHQIELCTHIGPKGSIALRFDGTKVLDWGQRLGERRIAAIHLIENDVKTFSINVDGVIVDGRPGTPV